jgi:hypothetical protein
MAGHEGSGSPTPSEQENHDDKNDDNNIQDEQQEAQEHDEVVNESSVQDIVREASIAGEINAEMAQPAHPGSSSDIMMEDPDAGPDLEEELGGVIIGEIENANGLVELLVMSVDSSPGTPELL